MKLAREADQSVGANVNPAIPELFDWPQHWTANVACCPMAIQASGREKKRKWWLTSMKIREHCLS